VTKIPNAVSAFQPVPRADREVIARLGNCILALADHKMMLYDTSILYTFEESLKFPVSLSKCKIIKIRGVRALIFVVFLLNGHFCWYLN